MVNITITEPTLADIQEYDATGLDGKACMEGCKKVTATDENGNTAILYVKEEDVSRLGKRYLQDNITLRHNKTLGEWQATLSQNAYYNDVERYPEATIEVAFFDEKSSDGAEIYRQIGTSKYYIRQASNREPFAKWYRCGPEQTGYEDIAEIRANITFKHGNQTEKVTFDDWNGNAAYSNTFNRNFRKGDDID